MSKKQRRVAEKYVNRAFSGILSGRGIADEYDALIDRGLGPLADAICSLYMRSGVFNNFFIERGEE